MVKAGDIVKVRVLEVDIPRKRIALTRRLDDTPAPQAPREERNAAPRSPAGPRRDGGRDGGRGQGGFNKPSKPAAPPADNALAAAFARAKGNG